MGWQASAWASPGSTSGSGGTGSTYDANPVDITPLSNGWTAKTPGPTYQKAIDGTVTLDGGINAGTTTIGTQLFTMPAGRRPASDTTLGVAATGGGSMTITIAAATGITTIAFKSGTVTGAFLTGSFVAA